MEYVTKGYEPSRMLEFFEEISAIPRGSGNEKGVADYLCEFADKRGLFCYRDTLHNVLIVREADESCKDMPSVALQGHSDMVFETAEEIGRNYAIPTAFRFVFDAMK